MIEITGPAFVTFSTKPTLRVDAVSMRVEGSPDGKKWIDLGTIEQFIYGKTDLDLLADLVKEQTQIEEGLNQNAPTQ
jgi:hypothetical protein